ncbi:hypothetical protein PQR34_14465 [Paraburkholderia sediminicola]|uniref:hypothetical protein n=1 Tax=Paraburkholderia sediminicola TaxID=458836 RepID=UPI0038BDC95E
MPQEPLELGKFLVSEITDHGSGDTLTIWLMHYIAEMIATAEKEGNSPLGRSAKKEAGEMILKLWEHRATLSGRANPMKEYVGALRLLHSLRREGYFVFGGLDTDGDPIDAFRRGTATLLGSLLVLLLPNRESGEDVAARSLSEVEKKIMRELHVIKIRRLAKIAEVDEQEDPRELLKRDILEDIARVRKSLDAIEANLASGTKLESRDSY